MSATIPQVTQYVIPFEQLKIGDVERVGGKNASIGEMIGQLARLGVKVPGGFATTADAYREFLRQGGLDERIREALATLAAALGLTLAQVEGVAGFYRFFHTRPVGRYRLLFSNNITDQMLGSQRLMDELCGLLGVAPGAVRGDGQDG
jgi:hypothetical protein